MKQTLAIAFALSLVLAVPFIFRIEQTLPGEAQDHVVVITPHTESIRHEFATGFRRWYREQTGRTVNVDYRVIGGTSEIGRFLESQYTNAFRLYWTETLGQPWTQAVREAYRDPRISLPENPGEDNLEQAARRAFLKSSVSSGIDVSFGGGSYDFIQNSNRGFLVPSDLLERHPRWFMETATPGETPPAIPRTFAGETFYDTEGRWFGAGLSSYGIIYNRDSLKRLGLDEEPTQWADLADPRFFGEIAVCDPTKSGSMTQAFEMIIQQQMQQRHRELLRTVDDADADSAQLETQAIREGWMNGLKLIQIISANARYFTDSSPKPNIDVATGDCAAGMSIDFYGRFQQENVLERSGDNRFGFQIPSGGTTVSADPIGKLRGARNGEVADRLIEYVLSEEGQKLWNFRVGTSGGPERYPLRRPPIRPTLYTPEHNEHRSDPEVNPYVAAEDFHYQAGWTAGLFNEIRVLIRVSFIDVRPELVAAWKAILRAEAEGRQLEADRARVVFSDLSRIDYERTLSEIRPGIRGSPIDEVRLARELSNVFRDQYLEAERIANGD